MASSPWAVGLRSLASPFYGTPITENPMTDRDALLRAAALAVEYLERVGDRPVGRPVDAEALRAALGGPLPEKGEDARAVLDALARGADPGLVASAGPRYFGFVTGGAVPASVGADWLASAWDQNAWTYTASPAGSVVEEVVGGWLVDLLGLPADTSVGFTTGATMASFAALAAARSAVLRRCGIDVEEQGLAGAPPVAVVVGDAVHATILAALQMLGLGRGRVRRVATDGQGRMQPDALRAALAGCEGAPSIVCAQAGEVNTGAFDPFPEIAAIARAHDAWLHVDGAFGLWAAASPRLRGLVAGVDQADSWSTDAHKWLNVPYDSGLVFVRNPEIHRHVMSLGAAYYVMATHGERDNFLLVPESSRRARGFAIWAALRSLGRSGVAEMIECCCALAQRMAERLRGAPGVELLNEVVLNQVLLRFAPPGGGDADAFTREVIRRIQADGTCWLGGSTWRSQAVARISVSNWSTTEADIDRSVEAILRCMRG
jgi:glutamate/tyrosine decarboxylase-like PLP-dependent enzyme